MLALALGLRRGEIVGLRWVNIDLDNRVIYVRRQVQRVRGDLYEDDPKGGDAPVPLPRIWLVALSWQRLRQAALRQAAGERWQETGYVFTTRTGRPVEARNIYRSFGWLSRKAGVPIIRLHDARHGCATLLTSQGVPPRVVMELLGHSQIGVTMNVYTRVFRTPGGKP